MLLLNLFIVAHSHDEEICLGWMEGSRKLLRRCMIHWNNDADFMSSPLHTVLCPSDSRALRLSSWKPERWSRTVWVISPTPQRSNKRMGGVVYVYRFTSFTYSWSCESVKTSVDEGLPNLWAMVYNSSLYRGFSFKKSESLFMRNLDYIIHSSLTSKVLSRYKSSLMIPPSPCVVVLSLLGPRLP